MYINYIVNSIYVKYYIHVDDLELIALYYLFGYMSIQQFG